MALKSRLRRLLTRWNPAPPPQASVTPSSSVWPSPDPGLSKSLIDVVDPKLTHAIQHQQLHTLAQPLGPGLWAIPFFTHAGCERLAQLIDHRLEWQRDHPQASPNSMHYAGVVFEPMGLAPAMTALRDTIIEPLRAALYPEFSALDDDYAFAATYGHQLDHRLGFHVDDSELTLNVALTGAHNGGEVVFQGRRCSMHRQEAHRPEEEIAVTIPKGHGLLHAGTHRHLVTTVSGERRNLIIWCRSSQTRQINDDSACPDWCGHQP